MQSSVGKRTQSEPKSNNTLFFHKKIKQKVVIVR